MLDRTERKQQNRRKLKDIYTELKYIIKPNTIHFYFNEI